MILVIKSLLNFIIFFSLLLAILVSCGDKPKANKKSREDTCRDINLVNNQGTLKFYRSFLNCFSLNKSYPNLNRFLYHVDEKGFDEIHKSYNSFFWNQESRHNVISLFKLIKETNVLEGVVKLIRQLQVMDAYQRLSFFKQDTNFASTLSAFLISHNDKETNRSLRNLYRILKIQHIDHSKDINSAFKGINLNQGHKIRLVDLFFENGPKLIHSLKPLFYHAELGWEWQSYLFENASISDFSDFFSFHRQNLGSMIGDFKQILNYDLRCYGNKKNYVSKMNLKEEAKYFIKDFILSHQNAADILVELNNKSLYLGEWCEEYSSNNLFSGFLKKSKYVVDNPVSYYYSAGFLAAYNRYYQNEFGVLDFYQTDTYEILHHMVQYSFKDEAEIKAWVNYFKGEDSQYFYNLYQLVNKLMSSKNFQLYGRFWLNLEKEEKRELLSVVSKLVMSSNNYTELLNFAHQFSQVFEGFTNISTSNNEAHVRGFSESLLTFDDFEALASDLERFIESGTLELMVKMMLELRTKQPVPEKKINNEMNSFRLAGLSLRPVKCDNLLSVFSSLDTINSNSLKKYDCMRRTNYAFTNIINQNLLSDSMSLPATKLFENQFITSFLLLGKWVHDSNLLSSTNHDNNEKNLINYYSDSRIKRIINQLFPLVKDFRDEGFEFLQDYNLSLSDWEFLSKVIQTSLKKNSEDRISFPFHREKFNCEEIKSIQGGKSCWSGEDAKKLIDKLFRIAGRESDAEPFLLRLLKMINPSVGIELPLRKKKSPKKSFSLLNFSRFIYDASEEDTIDRIRIHRREGSFYTELTMLEQLETVIREIGFNDNVYGNYFKNTIAKAKKYVKKVRGLRKWAKGLSAGEGIYRKRGKLDKDSDYYLKNVLTTFDSLIEVGTLRSKFHGGHYDKEVRLLISLVVGSSLKKVQSYFPVNPNKVIYKKHKGPFITELTNYSFLSQINHYLRKLKIGGKNALNDETFKLIDQNFGLKFDPQKSYDILNQLDQDNFKQDLFHLIDQAKDLSEADIQRLERVGYRTLYLVSNSQRTDFDFIFKLVRVLVKNKTIQSIVQGNLGELISFLDLMVEAWGRIQIDNPKLELKIFKHLEFIINANELILTKSDLSKRLNHLFTELIFFYKYNSDYLLRTKDREFIVDNKFNLVLSQITYNLMNNSDYLNLLIKLNIAESNSKIDGVDFLFDQFIHSLITKENIKEYFEHIINTIEVEKAVPEVVRE